MKKPTNVINKEWKSLSPTEKENLKSGTWGNYDVNFKTWNYPVFSGKSIKEFLLNNCISEIEEVGRVDENDLIDENSTTVKYNLKALNGAEIGTIKIYKPLSPIDLDKEIYFISSDINIETFSNIINTYSNREIIKLNSNRTKTVTFNGKLFYYLLLKNWSLEKAITSNNENIKDNFLTRESETEGYSIAEIKFDVPPINLGVTFTFNKIEQNE